MWSRPIPKSNMDDCERMSNVGNSSSEPNSSSEDESMYEHEMSKKSTSNESGSTCGSLRGINQSCKYEQSGLRTRPRPKAQKRKSVLQVYSDFNNRSGSVEKLAKMKQEDEDEFQPSRYKNTAKRQKCHSHNAIMARQNRLKKKQYLEKLENNISQLSGENKKLKVVVSSQTETVASLQDRVRYLEGVLANSREISKLLKSVRQGTGLPIINSLQPTSGNSSPSHGCPPPQPDHIYSRMPDEVSSGYLSSGEDLGLLPNSILSDDYLNPLPLLSADDPFSLMPADDNLHPYSSDPDLDTPFDFENMDADELLADVGICLHIAKKRVSLEFCNSCNSNAVAAWDQQQAEEN